MKKLEYQLRQMTFHNRDGSYGTQRGRLADLMLIARQLNELGFNQMNVYALRRKHVDALLGLWKARDLSSSRIKNCMSALRWWARKVSRDDVIPSTNRELDIPQRKMIPESSKAQWLDSARLDLLPNERMRLSVELQQLFGLRQEESLKFSPAYADQDTFVRLKGSWTKGGRPREIPIVEESQRSLLNRVHDVARSGSMIPSEFSYFQWRNRYQSMIGRCGFSNLHGLRHGYAQRRYHTLAGWQPPFAGGPSSRELEGERAELDKKVRLVISRELGHNRIDITDVYLGR